METIPLVWWPAPAANGLLMLYDVKRFRTAVKVMDPKCELCCEKIRFNMPKLIWTCFYNKYYHHRCLEQVLGKAKKFDEIDRIMHPPSANAIFVQTDVMECAECGGYSGGYGRKECMHCKGKLQENGSRYVPPAELRGQNV